MVHILPLLVCCRSAYFAFQVKCFIFKYMLACLGDPTRSDCHKYVYWLCMNGSLAARSKRSKSIGQDAILELGKQLRGTKCMQC